MIDTLIPKETSAPSVIYHSLNYEEFDSNLMRAFGCLKALNFRHIAFIGRELDKIPEDEAHRVLWHESLPTSDITFMRLKKLCAKGWIIPWQPYDPDFIMPSRDCKASPKKNKIFYCLGNRGRDWLKEKLNFVHLQPMPDEFSKTAFPIIRWLTASSCALSLVAQGYHLLSIERIWNNITGERAPDFRPEFVLEKNKQIAFYIFYSAFGLNAEYYVSHVLRGLKCLNQDCSAVILTSTKEAFIRTAIAINSITIQENKKKIFIGEYTKFKIDHGHTRVINVEMKEMLL